MTYTRAYIKTLPAPSIRKLLREAGWTQKAIAERHGCRQSVVSHLVRKGIESGPLWDTISWCLNHPKNGRAA